MYGIPFLQAVAEDIVKNNGNDLSNLIVIFPNNRAQLFFNDYLFRANGNDTPIWAPAYTTIQRLFKENSSLQVADPVKLVCLLYEVYMKVLTETTNPYDELDDREETLDSFYHWGEILLADFEDIDNNLVDAQMLFSNISDGIPFEEDNSHLTPDQKEVLERFFAVFKDGSLTKLKRRFLRLWSVLGPVYDKFKERLLSENIAYEGMLKRSVVESIEDSDPFDDDKQYLFVGFNVLNKCEKKLFKKLKDSGRARFYWDCDEFYMKASENGKWIHEAGLFMRENVLDYGNALETCNLLGSCNRNVDIIGSATENFQARYVSSFLEEQRKKGASDSDSVVVLCNESLLLPVLHSVPSSLGGKDLNVNVTMGLPIVQTPIYGLMQQLLEYQERLSFLGVSLNKGSVLSTTILPLTRNYYLRGAFPNIKDIEDKIQLHHVKYFKLADLVSDGQYGALFAPQSDPMSLLKWIQDIVRSVSSMFRKEDEEMDNGEDSEYVEALSGDLYKESLYRIYNLMSRLISLMDEGSLNIEFPMMLQLIDTMMSSISVPFTGDMAEGTQIMGFLETRNLDFSNVILLSANEGTLPTSGKDSSFIPYALRKGYGMTTIEHKNSLYAYYFYRLLQRAENVTLMYNTSTDSSSKGQMSRFILQLMVEAKNNQFKRYSISSDAPKNESFGLCIEKTPEMIAKMRELFDFEMKDGKRKTFSASSFSDYIDCPLKFYLKKVQRIGKPDEVSDDVQVNEFGTVFHAAMQNFYDLMPERSQITLSTFPEFLHSSNEETHDLDDASESTKYFKEKVKGCVAKAFKEHYFRIKEGDDMPALSGVQQMNFDAIVRYVIRMLRVDAQYTPFRVLGNEHEFNSTMDVELKNGETIKVGFYGSIDRVDEKGDTIRILDYKTGSKLSACSDIPSLFEYGLNRNKHVMQVLMYSYFYSKENKGTDVKLKPVISYLSNCNVLSDLDVLVDKNVIDSAQLYFSEVEEGIKRVIKELFDIETPFVSHKDGKGCDYCDFKSMCGVKEKSY